MRTVLKSSPPESHALESDVFSKQAEFTVALIGNPNTGKSTIFNALSGSKQKIANFPGVTVEKKTAFKKLGEQWVRFIDLPGCYSLQAASKDEKIAVDYLKGNTPNEKKPDLILFICDATNLKRNFYLLSQIIEFGIPILVVLTMIDRLGLPADIQSSENFKKGLKLKKIEGILGLNIIPVVSYRQEHLEYLKKKLFQRIPPPPPQNLLMQRIIQQYLKDSQGDMANDKIPAYVFPRLRYQWASEISQTFTSQQEGLSGYSFSDKKTWSGKLDKFLTHKYSGFLFFIGVVYIMFELMYSCSEPIMEQIETGIQALSGFVDQNFMAHPIWNSMLVDGIIPGVGAVLIFLPQVVFLFMFIALLEDSGYIARAVFLMDKIFSWSGLNGRSFVPMLSSFACAVPGIISARVISDHKTRLATVLVSPLMSCSARLPIYILLIGAFIEPVYGSFWAGFTLFFMHMIGPLVALPVSKIIASNYQAKHNPVFFLEMPPYRKPLIKNILYSGYLASKKFLMKAGGIILALSFLIWLLSYFPRNPEVEKKIRESYNQKTGMYQKAGDTANIDLHNQKIEGEIASKYLEDSYLGRVGKAVQPIFQPLGYDWKITVAILSAFPAREVFISSMGILYNVDAGSDNEKNIREKLAYSREKKGMTSQNPLFALSLMIFFALCCQCMSTLVVIQRELGSWGWAFFTFVYMTSLAYVFAFVVYQVGFIFVS